MKLNVFHHYGIETHVVYNCYNFIKIDPPSSIPDLQLFSADFPGNTITSSLFLALIILLSKILCNPKQHYAYNSLKKGRKTMAKSLPLGVMHRNWE